MRLNVIMSVRESRYRSDACKSILVIFAIFLSMLIPPNVSADPYPPHSSIIITDNSEFNATNGVVGGNGSPANPFIIEGWEIWGGAAAISISNTNASFLIRNVSLYGDSSIRITNATNGVITHIETHPTSQSILIDHASNISITRTTLAYGGFSVYMTDSQNCSIDNSTLIESFTMLLILYSQNISIMDNYFGSNSRNMVIRFSSIFAQNNDFGPSSVVDVQLENDNGSIFRNNSIISYFGDGFWIYDSINTTVEENHFSDVDPAYNIPYGIGILAVNSSNINAVDNDISQRTYAIEEIDSRDCNYIGNSINRSTTGIMSVNSSGMRASRNDLMTVGPSVVLHGTSNSNLSDSNMTGTDFGIQLIQSSRIRIDNCKVNATSLTGTAIDISRSSDILATNLSILWSSTSISLDNSDNISVVGGNLSAITCAKVSYSTDILFDSNILTYGIPYFVNYGISLSNSKRISILRNEILSNSYGIFTTSTSGAWIEGNRILSGGYGLYTESSKGFSISNNLISGQEMSISIDLPAGDNPTPCSNFTISSNYFEGGIRSRQSADVIISNNTFNGTSIMLSSDNPGMRIADNKFLNWSGISLDAAHSVTIERNNFFSCGISIWGISFKDYHSNVIRSDNLVGGNPVYYVSDKATFNISNIPVGQLIIVNVTSVNISRLSIKSSWVAILLAYVDDAVIQRSNIIDNYVGVRLVNVDHTLIHHNNFINNSDQIWATPYSSEITLYLSYPFGGNYWSSYINGSDQKSGEYQNNSGADGFFDNPYLSPNGTDAYPLALPYTDMRPIAIVQISPSIGDLSTIFRFDASGSMDLEDASSLLQVRWDFNGDGIWDTDWSTNKTIDHQYSAPGQYEIHFQVRDTSGAMSNHTSLIVVGEGNPPSPSILPIVLVAAAVTLSLLGLGYSLMKVRQSSSRNANLKDGQNVQNTNQGDPSGGSGPHIIIRGSRGGGAKP